MVSVLSGFAYISPSACLFLLELRVLAKMFSFLILSRSGESVLLRALTGTGHLHNPALTLGVLTSLISACDVLLVYPSLLLIIKSPGCSELTPKA